MIAAHTRGFLHLPDIVECLARLAAGDGNHQNAARLFGAADAIRHQIGVARFPVYQAGYDAAIGSLRDALGEGAFDAAWAEGAALSIEEAIAYAQRGRGKHKRPNSGWESLTPTETDVVRLVTRRVSQQRHRCTASHLTPDRANSPHPRLHQTWTDLAGTTRPGSSTPHLTCSQC